MITSIEKKIREREEEELYSFLTSTQRSIAEKLQFPEYDEEFIKEYGKRCEPEKFKEINSRIEERRRRRWEQMWKLWQTCLPKAAQSAKKNQKKFLIRRRESEWGGTAQAVVILRKQF